MQREGLTASSQQHHGTAGGVRGRVGSSQAVGSTTHPHWKPALTANSSTLSSRSSTTTFARGQATIASSAKPSLHSRYPSGRERPGPPANPTGTSTRGAPQQRKFTPSHSLPRPSAVTVAQAKKSMSTQTFVPSRAATRHEDNNRTQLAPPGRPPSASSAAPNRPNTASTASAPRGVGPRRVGETSGLRRSNAAAAAAAAAEGAPAAVRPAHATRTQAVRSTGPAAAMAARASPPAVSPTTASAAAAAGVAHPLKGSPQGLSVDSLVGAGAEGSDSPGFSDEVFDNTNLSEILGASTTEELDAKELGRLQRGGGHALVAPRPAAKRLTLGPARRTTVYAAPPPLSAAARQQAMQSYHAEMDRLQKRTSIYAGPMRVPVKMPTRDETGRAFQELSFNASLNSENLTRTVGKAMLPQKADTETKMVHPLSQQAGFGAPAGLPKPNMTAMIPSRMAAPSAAPASPMAPRRVPNPLASVQAAAVLVPLPATPQRVPNILSTPLRVIQQDTARLIGMAVMDVSAPGSARLKALGQREADVSSPFLKRSERVEAPMRPQNRFLSMLRSEVASDDADQNEEVGRPTNGHTGQKLPHMETTLDSPLSLSDLTLASVDRSAEPKHCAPRQQLLPDPFELLGLTDPIGDVEKEGPTDARTANGPDDDAIIQLIGDRNMHLVQVPQGFGHVDVVDEAQLSSELDAMKAEEESLLREIQKLGHFEDA